MLILFISPTAGTGKSVCAVNLACELAGHDPASSDRWQGEHSVVLVDADAAGAASRCYSAGRLPVSGERHSAEDLTDLDGWVRRMTMVAMNVDYIVVDGPLYGSAATRSILGICDMVIVPCWAHPGEIAAVAPLVELVKSARSARSDGGPKCLLVPVLTDVGNFQGSGIDVELPGFDEAVSPAIRQSAEFADAFNAGHWIGSVAPESDAHTEIKVLAANVNRALGRSTVACHGA